MYGIWLQQVETDNTVYFYNSKNRFLVNPKRYKLESWESPTWVTPGGSIFKIAPQQLGEWDE